jgi:hypothetical protein
VDNEVAQVVIIKRTPPVIKVNFGYPESNALPTKADKKSRRKAIHHEINFIIKTLEVYTLHQTNPGNLTC